MRSFLYLFIILSLLQACSPTKDRLEEALERSGENRAELEKVLAHFSNEGDSIHLKSAQYLIANMPGHYSWECVELEHYWHYMDSVYPDMSSVVKKVVYSIPWHSNQVVMNRGVKREDIKNVKAEFLIGHINNAVAMWKECSWLRSMAFEDFCEYLLPYRVGDEPLILMDSTQYWWKNVKEDMLLYNYTPVMLNEIRHFLRTRIGDEDNLYFSKLDIGTGSPNKYTMDCLDMCYYDVIGLRQAGVPSTIDLVPHWATRNGRHYWRTIPDALYMNGNDGEGVDPVAGKVYRMTYSHHPVPETNGGDSIPEFFRNPFLKDVSDKYLQTSDIEININRKLKGRIPANIYLAVFNELEWKPIAWSVNEGNKACFRKMGRGVVYLPVYYKGSEMKCADYPFYTDRTGKKKSFVPDKDSMISVTLDRKFPLTYSKIHWGKMLEGCVLEASDNARFLHPDTLAQITEAKATLNWRTLPVKGDKRYQYWRVSKFGRPVSFAELQLISKEGNVLQGKPMYSGSGGFSEKAFDNDPLTYHNYFYWVGCDLGKPLSLKEVRYLPRTDYNGIIPGHLYRLLYFAEDGWVEVETKEATEQSITFRHVPEGALYWLQNLTEGKEERIFSVEGKQVVFY